MKTAAAHKQIYFWLYLIAAITFITGVSSCNIAGNCVPEPPKPVDGRIKTEAGYGTRNDFRLFSQITIERVEYTYDDKNRVQSSEFNFYDGPGFAVRYEYQAQSVTYDNGGSIVVYQLNSQGYADNVYGEPRTYDNEGHMLTGKINNGGILRLTWDANGNLTKKETVGSGIIITYTYTNKKDLRVDGFDWLYGKHSTNLPAAEISSNGITKEYEYAFDQSGRVTQVKFNDKYTGYTYFN